MRKLRVLQAPIVALYTPSLYCKGMRALGHKADQMVFTAQGNEWLLQLQPDYNLRSLEVGGEAGLIRELEFLYRALDDYDIIHLHTNFSMLSDFEKMIERTCDLDYLKASGKKIVNSYWGWCDACDAGVPRPGGYSECDVCTIAKPDNCKNPRHNRGVKRMMDKADLLLSNMILTVAFPNVQWINNAIDIDLWRPMARDEIPAQYRLPETDKLRIYHAFGNSDKRDDVKGSKYIKAAVERLQGEGYPVEFMFFDKVPNVDLRYYQAQADLVIDQLYAGWHGSNGVECMAVGKPVVTHIEPLNLQAYGKPVPFIDATPDTIYDVIKDLISDRDRLKEIGEASRAYAVKEHDYRVIAKRLEALYYGMYDEGEE